MRQSGCQVLTALHSAVTMPTVNSPTRRGDACMRERGWATRWMAPCTTRLSASLGRRLGRAVPTLLLCVVLTASACGSAASSPRLRPFDSHEVIARFAQHGLGLEIFGRGTAACAKTSAGCVGGSSVAVTLQTTDSTDDVLRYVVDLYRTAADAEKEAPDRLVRVGRFDKLTGARFAFLRRGNVVVGYVADVTRLRHAYRGYLGSAIDVIPAIKAALTSLR